MTSAPTYILLGKGSTKYVRVESLRVRVLLDNRTIVYNKCRAGVSRWRVSTSHEGQSIVQGDIGSQEESEPSALRAR